MKTCLTCDAYLVMVLLADGKTIAEYCKFHGTGPDNVLRQSAMPEPKRVRRLRRNAA